MGKLLLVTLPLAAPLAPLAPEPRKSVHNRTVVNDGKNVVRQVRQIFASAP